MIHIDEFGSYDLIQDILPAKEVSILAGASGAGKTTLLMQTIAAIQRGGEVFGHAVHPDVKVGYIAADRTWAAYMRLAQQVGVDISQLVIKALIDDDSLDISHIEKSP